MNKWITDSKRKGELKEEVEAEANLEETRLVGLETAHLIRREARAEEMKTKRLIATKSE